MVSAAQSGVQVFAPDTTFCACATALPSHSALIRLSGPTAKSVAAQAELPEVAPWRVCEANWQLTLGSCPVRVSFAQHGKSFTGYDLIEIVLPGAPIIVEVALACLQGAGAEPAPPGAFTRQALACGRLSLDQAEGILAVSQAGSAEAAQAALGRLQGALSAELEPLRKRLVYLRALVEAGLDFIEEDDVSAYAPEEMQAAVREALAIIRRWQRAAVDLGLEPVVCLAGPANAGKSALFAALTGEAPLVSPVAGTTRDWLVGTIELAGRPIQVIDTAGWLDASSQLDDEAIEQGRDRLAQAAVIVLCSAPDARLPDPLPDSLPIDRSVIVATKADIGGEDPRASLAVSSSTGQGLATLEGHLARALAQRCGGDPRQQRLLAAAAEHLESISNGLPDDELLAAELRQVCDLLGDLLGRTTNDDVLHTIFGQFCIGK